MAERERADGDCGGGGVSSVVYRYWSDEELLYIGVTDDIFRRDHEHRKYDDWTERATSITLEHFSSRMMADCAEWRAIRLECPVFNTRGVEGEFNHRISHDCPHHCTLENTVRPYSAHWDLGIDQSVILDAYHRGEIHGHELLHGPKLLIASLVEWASTRGVLVGTQERTGPVETWPLGRAGQRADFADYFRAKFLAELTNNPHDPRHGLEGTYAAGCHCARCREAHNVTVRKYRTKVRGHEPRKYTRKVAA